MRRRRIKDILKSTGRELSACLSKIGIAHASFSGIIGIT